MGRRWFSLLFVAIPALAGCDLDLGDAPFYCCPTCKPKCPSGYECKGNVCIKEGTCPAGVPGCGGVVVDAAVDTKPPPDMLLLPDKRPPDLKPHPDQPLPPGGFGDRCDAVAKCAVGLDCMTMTTPATHGFCTKQCPQTNPPQECMGAPTGTSAYCILPSSSGQQYCAFVCKLSTQSWPCPSQLTCDTQPNPPGSQQHLCKP